METPRKNLKLLIVEDDNFIRDLYVRELRRIGHTVVEAIDGQQGVDLFKTSSCDLVLLDVMLPKKTGIDVLRDIRSWEAEIKKQKVPIFLLTNLGQESIINEAFRLGADGYFLKARVLPTQIGKEIDAFFAGKPIDGDGLGIVQE